MALNFFVICSRVQWWERKSESLNKCDNCKDKELEDEKKQAFVVDLKNLIGHRSKNKNVWQMIVQYVLTKCFSFHFSSVFLSLSSDFLCMYAYTFLRVEIQGEEVGAKFSKSQPPPPNLEFYCIFLWQFQIFFLFWHPHESLG